MKVIQFLTMFKLIISLVLDNTFTEKDFLEEELVIIFYDSTLNELCDTCKIFAPLIYEKKEIQGYKIRTVDFFKDEETCLKFFVVYVPHIILRKNFRSYNLYPSSINHLEKILNDKLWSEDDKFAWFLEPNKFYMKYFAKMLKVTLRMSDKFGNFWSGVPRECILLIYFGIFSYLVISIYFILVDLRSEDKLKEE